MRWPSRCDRIAAKGWHRRFAWFPVWMDDQGCWCWLEFYEQRGTPRYWLNAAYIEWETRGGKT